MGTLVALVGVRRVKLKRAISLLAVATLVGAELPSLGYDIGLLNRCCAFAGRCLCKRHGNVCCCRKRNAAGWWAAAPRCGNKDSLPGFAFPITIVPVVHVKAATATFTLPVTDPCFPVTSSLPTGDKPRSPPGTVLLLS